MRKQIVLDTNVLLYDTDCLMKFKDNDIIIPLVVIEELDYIKDDWKNPELAQASREVTRNILELDEIIGDLKTVKNLREGISYTSDKEGTTTLKIVDEKELLAGDIRPNATNDDYIIHCAKKLGAILITRDNNMVLKASGNCMVELYNADSIKKKEVYKGYKIITVSPEFMEEFSESGKIRNMAGLLDDGDEFRELYPNEFLIMQNEFMTKQKLFGICKGDFILKIDLDNLNKNGMVLNPMGLSQKLAMYLLLQTDIDAISFLGGSGTGKTSLSVDYALNEVSKFRYNQLYYAKSLKGLAEDEDYGFLPGDVNDKMQEVIIPLISSLELLESVKQNKNNARKAKENKLETERFQLGEEILAKYREDGTLRILPLNYLRGMTITNKVVILDEGQNLTIPKMKTLVTRMSDSSKLIITGDDNQIDDKNLNKYNNGLAHFVEKGKYEPFIAHLTMDLDDNASKRGKVSNFGNTL